MFRVGFGRLYHSSTRIDLVRLVSACVDVAGRAGALVQKVFGNEQDWEHTTIDKTALVDEAPGPGYMLDPRTVADLQSQNLIIGSLQREFPQLMLIGEEVGK